MNTREANGSKHGGQAIAVKGWSWELLEELLNAADQGGDLAGGAWGATEEGRRGREFLGYVCESESFIRFVMLYLSS